jgi:hypothetical protein
VERLEGVRTAELQHCNKLSQIAGSSGKTRPLSLKNEQNYDNTITQAT